MAAKPLVNPVLHDSAVRRFALEWRSVGSSTLGSWSRLNRTLYPALVSLVVSPPRPLVLRGHPKGGAPDEESPRPADPLP